MSEYNELSGQIHYIPLIIPTVLIPFTLLSVGISVVATFIAGLFGYQLQAEGPKQLLEILLRPKVLMTALALNLIFWGGYQLYHHTKNLPAFLWKIQKNHRPEKTVLTKYPHRTHRPNHYTSSKEKAATTINSLKITQKWTRKLPKGAFRSPTLSGDRLFISSLDGHIYEFSLRDKKIIRNFFIGTPIAAPSTIFKNKLYSGEGTHYTHHARLYQIDLISGEHKKNYSSKGHIEGQPVIGTFAGKSLIFVVAGKDGIHALDPRTMKKVWSAVPGHIDAAVRVEKGIVYVSTGREKGDAKKHRTYALAYDFLTGKELWKNELPMSGWMEPALTQKYACFILGEIYFQSNIGGITCFDKLTGTPEFSIFDNTPMIGIPLTLNNDLFISSLSGKVCRIDVEKRARKWCTQVPIAKKKDKNGPIKQMTALSYHGNHHLLVYTTTQSGLYFLSPKTGKIIKSFSPNKEETPWTKTYAPALILKDGGIITIDKAGVMRKLEVAVAP